MAHMNPDELIDSCLSSFPFQLLALSHKFVPGNLFVYAFYVAGVCRFVAPPPAGIVYIAARGEHGRSLFSVPQETQDIRRGACYSID